MKNKIYFIDAVTGEETVREMTADEQKARDAEIAQWLSDEAATKEKLANEKSIKIAAYKKLGLTDEEIEALLPNENPQPIFNNA
jgi:hypothetical protein